LLIGLTASRCLFAGKEFLAGPREEVVADQLVVRLQLGADINQILAALVPQALASLVSRDRNTYLLQLPAGIQAVASKLLAAHPLVQYVEPNRIRHSTVLPPNDSLLPQQWALTTIQAVEAWSYFPDHYLTAANPSANRVKVAVLDSGTGRPVGRCGQQGAGGNHHILAGVPLGRRLLPRHPCCRDRCRRYQQRHRRGFPRLSPAAHYHQGVGFERQRHRY
jgi:hypothetical protein